VPPARPIVALGELLWDLLPTGPRAGGAPFNFAFHCHQLGHPAVIVSRVGDDDLGRQLRDEVRRLGMSDEYIQTDLTHPTGTVSVKLDATGQPTYAITENVAWDFIEWEPRLESLAESARAVCFGTLAQRQPVSRETIRQFVREVTADSLVVCDLNLREPYAEAGVIRETIPLADWLKVNEAEAEVVIAVKRFAVAWVRPAAEYMLAALPPDHAIAVVTRGERGCHVADRRQVIDLHGVSVQVADTVGAGDAFTAALLTQHLEGKSLREAARFANAYAAVVASKVGGTPTVTRAEVERLL
jgi:fructokinase